jgi:AcrR family transcriptional regulator
MAETRRLRSAPGPADAGSSRPAGQRVRDKEARRAAIIAAARAAFAEQGYAKTTIREIARRAKVTHGLVVLHFGTKEQLFVAAMPGTGDLGSFVEGDVGTLPDRIARAYVQRMESASSADPFLALIRSAASDQDAAKKLLMAMGQHSTESYRAVLPGDDIEMRVASLGAYLIGVTFSRYVLREGPLAAASRAELEACLVPAIRGILLNGT